MNVRRLLEHIDSFAPFSLAEDWDNPGLLVGSYSAEVRKTAVCLDAVTDAVVEAHKHDCNVLVCHHPLIFRPVKKVITNSEQGRTIIEAAKLSVNIIAAHTNWDRAPGGVNDVLASLLGLGNCKPLDDDSGFGVVGVLDEAMSVNDFLGHVKRSWGLSHVDFYADTFPEKITRVALCGGSGAEFWRKARHKSADVYLTADMKYHELADAVREGLAVGLINHGEMERATIPELAHKISECGTDTITLDVNAMSEPLRI